MFQASNNSIYLWLGLTVLAGLVIGIMVIRRSPAEKRVNILTGLLIAYLALYLPILDYWSIWLPDISFWPGNFMVDKSLIFPPPENELLYDRIYTTLNTVSILIAITAISLFIYQVANKPGLSQREKVLVCVPYVNYFQLFVILKRKLITGVKMPLLVLWLIISFAAGYYSFLALPLFALGFNSFGIFELIIWGKSQVGELAGDADSYYAVPYDISLYVDINHIVLPVLYWLSALLTLVIVRLMKREQPAELPSEGALA